MIHYMYFTFIAQAVVHYTQQKEIRSENPIVTEHAVEDNTAAQER